jgi:hypothetical protein
LAAGRTAAVAVAVRLSPLLPAEMSAKRDPRGGPSHRSEKVMLD